MIKTRICVYCKHEFTNSNPHQKYCNRDCYLKATGIDMPICPICNKKFRRAQGYRKTCSNKCFGIYNDNLVISELEKKLNINMENYLKQRYCIEDKSIKDIEIELGMADNHRRLKRWFKKYGIRLRTLSESVKLQHKKNPHRGKLYGQMNSSHEIRKLQAISKQKLAKLSSVEKAGLSILKGIGLNPIPHYAFDIYNIDLALPDKNIGIEINGGNWHNEKNRLEIDNRRDDFLIKNGWIIKRFKAEEFNELLSFAMGLT